MCLQIYHYLKTRNLKPKQHILDNEYSKAVRTFIRGSDTNIQLVELHNHPVNAAETAVKATKYHIITGLTTFNDNYPLQMWDLFIPQMQSTLNLLCTYCRDQQKCAYEELEGPFNFNCSPISTLGMEALAFVDPE